MLSIEECRACIDDQNITDEEISRIRAELYGLGELALEQYFQKLNNKGNKSIPIR